MPALFNTKQCLLREFLLIKILVESDIEPETHKEISNLCLVSTVLEDVAERLVTCDNYITISGLDRKGLASNCLA